MAQPTIIQGDPGAAGPKHRNRKGIEDISKLMPKGIQAPTEPAPPPRPQPPYPPRR